MASGCYGRRLSELLQEQQEPFLPVAGARPFGEKGDAGRRRSALGGALRKALRRWDVTGTAVAGCFLPCGAAGGLERFRQLRRAHDDYCDCDDGGGARRLSPVSVLDVLHADDEDSNWEDEDRPSTSSVSSQPSDADLDLAGFTRFYTAAAKIRSTEAPHDDAEKTVPPPPTTTTSGNKSMDEKEVEQRTTVSSSWESVAADIARIPLLLELDLSGGLAQERRRRRRRRLGEEEAEEEAWGVGASIEAMIFEEMRGEAVRDMID